VERERRASSPGARRGLRHRIPQERGAAGVVTDGLAEQVIPFMLELLGPAQIRHREE
jgi:hypothetical protein